MGFLGVRQPSSQTSRLKHPNVNALKRRKRYGVFSETETSKRQKPNHVPFLDGLPLEILEQIFVESANPDFVLTNKTIFAELNSTCTFLRSKMVLNWADEKEVERESTTTAEPEQQEQNQEQQPEMTQEQIDQDIQNHIHHPQTFHIDDMVVDQPEDTPELQNNTDGAMDDDSVKLVLPVEYLRWKFVTVDLLENLGIEISGKTIPDEYAAIGASQRQKDLLPLLKRSGLAFQRLPQVLSRAAPDADHFKYLVKLDFGPPTITCLVAALRHTSGEALLKDRNNMNLLPNWLIRSGYYVDKLSSDELWSFLVAYPDRNLVRYFLQMGVVPSERLLHQIPAL